MVYEDIAFTPDQGCEVASIIDVARLPVAIYSEKPVLKRVTEAMLSGAIDYLQWPITSEALHRTVQYFQRNGAAYSHAAVERAKAADLVSRLSQREADVVKGIVDGQSSKEIGRSLGISHRTVEIYRANAFRKLDAASAADVVRIGLYAGMDVQPSLDERTEA